MVGAAVGSSVGFETVVVVGVGVIARSGVAVRVGAAVGSRVGFGTVVVVGVGVIARSGVTVTVGAAVGSRVGIVVAVAVGVFARSGVAVLVGAAAGSRVGIVVAVTVGVIAGSDVAVPMGSDEVRGDVALTSATAVRASVSEEARACVGSGVGVACGRPSHATINVAVTNDTNPTIAIRRILIANQSLFSRLRIILALRDFPSRLNSGWWTRSTRSSR